MIDKETLAKYIEIMREYVDQDISVKQQFLDGYLKALEDLEKVFLLPIGDKKKI